MPAALDPEIAHHLQQQAARVAPAGATDRLALRRAALHGSIGYLRGQRRRAPRRAVGAVDREHRTAAGPVRVREYEAAGAPPQGRIVYLHGGGWVAGSIDSHDDLARHLADLTGMRVASVDYPLSPEARHPAAQAQCLELLGELAGNGAPRQPLVLAGDSAGAHIAAAVANQARVPVDAMLLLYPVVRPVFDTTSYVERGHEGVLTRELMQWFWEQYLGRLPAAADQPPATQDLTRQHWDRPAPPTVLLTAWHDPLADEGRLYADHLRRCGATVAFREAADMNHGFARYLEVSAAAYAHVQRAAADLLALLGMQEPAQPEMENAR